MPKSVKQGLALGCEHDVLRLHIAVNHARAVGVGEGAADGRDDFVGAGQAEAGALAGLLLQYLLEIWSVNELHHHEVDIALVVVVKDLDDIGMAQRSDGAGLAAKALAGTVFLQQEGMQTFTAT